MCRAPLVCDAPTPICGLHLLGDNNNNNKSNESSKRRQAWLARSVAQRTVSFVEQEVNKWNSTCRFLQDSPVCQEISPLQRSELQLGKLLGEGAFSQVYSIRRVQLQDVDDSEHDEAETAARTSLVASSERLVVKHLRSDLRNNEKVSTFHQAAADLVLEAQFLSRLNHPNIVPVRGWAAGGVSSYRDGSHDGYFMILPQLDETLSQRITHWKQEKHSRHYKMHHFALKLKFAREIASALNYLHEQDIIYRDLKPDNIGIKGDSIQLFDFGLARELPRAQVSEDENEEPNKLFHMSGVGTRRYMAPEVALKDWGYNLQADIYSFGIVLWELFTLSKPYELYNRKMHMLLVCVEGQRPALPSHWPVELQELLQSSWVPEPALRPRMSTLQQQLETMFLIQERQESSSSKGRSHNSKRGGRMLQSFKSRFTRNRQRPMSCDMTVSTDSSHGR